eukprot:CAMPEP_0181192720 /NCGR_PEP_ID=MMETSP1096-20121128/13434_1 /TAXON_ID=156174 ORGANISM="Chrysochromulina ericina, Strain CCMP281" /NCGR_SAMPLE_ID=MMETSP1096 /ASSEMBLY_ACC=CAM_ASM_000453 /LENGTH=151 /DNA_ID=CAMNT_0023282135 /DNA_START=461 /DNA_END=914 /DNA_ORIENTATION=-
MTGCTGGSHVCLGAAACAVQWMAVAASLLISLRGVQQAFVEAEGIRGVIPLPDTRVCAGEAHPLLLDGLLIRDHKPVIPGRSHARYRSSSLLARRCRIIVPSACLHGNANRLAARFLKGCGDRSKKLIRFREVSGDGVLEVERKEGVTCRT